MSRLLNALGRLATSRPRSVLLTWIVVLVAVVVASAGVESKTGGDAALPGTDSQAASAAISAAFPGDRAASSPIVLHATEGALSDQTAGKVAERLERTDAVQAAAPTGRSKDGHTAVVTVELATDPANLTAGEAQTLLDTARAAAGAGVQVEAAGAVGQKLSVERSHRSELVGLAVAMVVLLLIGGTVPAMLLPIGTAVVGLIVALRVLALVGSATSLPTAALTLATMMGLGVGIDYALFLLSRVREFRGTGATTSGAVRQALTTTGSAILFAGATVALALISLAVVRIPLITKLGGAAAIAVVVAVAAAVTLLPALLVLLGDRLDRLPVRRGPRGSAESPGWHRWGRAVARRPWTSALASLAVLLALAAPATTLELGSQQPANQPESTTIKRATDLITAAFGPGAAGPLTVVATFDAPVGGADDPRVKTLRAGLEDATGVSSVGAPRVGQDRRTVQLTVTPTTGPGTNESAALLTRLRTQALPQAGPGAVTHVGGSAALAPDLASRISAALPVIIGTVVALSFLLLLVAFRSLVLPAKAAVMNLLSVGAAYGVLTAVFQHGIGASLIGLSGPVPVVSYVPMIMFAVLFGLSMDYELFLLGRVQELHLAGESDEDSIVRGLASTGRIITAAALIMVGVFGSFLLSSDPTIKMFGLGLSVAIVIDATIVRCLLVPAAMLLLGRANWWLPRWLDRRLPAITID